MAEMCLRSPRSKIDSAQLHDEQTRNMRSPSSKIDSIMVARQAFSEVVGEHVRKIKNKQFGPPVQKKKGRVSAADVFGTTAVGKASPGLLRLLETAMKVCTSFHLHLR